MDFSLSEDQEALRGLARQILEDQVTQARLKEVEAGSDGIDRRTWDELAKAGLVGIALPEEHGGGGLGFVEVAVVLEEIGRTVAPVPYWASVVTGALPITEFGTDAQKSRWLPGAASGELILTAALQELGNDDAGAPVTMAKRAGDAWTLHGTKVCVPAAHLAAAVLVPARTDHGVQMFIVDTTSDGIELERNVSTSGEPVFTVTFNGAAGETLGDGEAVVAWTLERAVTGLCIIEAGIAERALRITAEYVSTREQFDHPLAAFQAVSQRTADAYVDVEAIRLTAWQAASLVAEGAPATDEIAIAKFWAGDGGNRVVHAAQHLHGGIGVDVDYPLHRYFTKTREIELTLGSSTRQLAFLGRRLAAATASS